MNLSLNSMSERERRMVVIGTVIAVLVLLFGIVLPLDRSVAKARQRIVQKTSDLAWMRSVTPELAAQGPAAPVSQDSLLVVVDRSARESNLGTSLAGSEPSGAGGLRVRLEKAPFDTLVAWLARLSEQNGIRVDSATIDNADKPGLVNAAVVLHTR